MSKEREEGCLEDQLWRKPRLLDSPLALAPATWEAPGLTPVGALCLLSPRVSSETLEGDLGAEQGCAGRGGGVAGTLGALHVGVVVPRWRPFHR